MKPTRENINAELCSINREQEKAIKTLEDVLSFLKGVRNKNEESLVNIKRSLDDLQSSLKYLPIETPFSVVPTQIKADILSYLCDSGAFIAASVCKEWKIILKKRIQNTTVRIGKHCSNKDKCPDYKCFMPAEMLRVSAALKPDIGLNIRICHPVSQLDSKLITDGLAGVSNLSLSGWCNCESIGNYFTYKEAPLMSVGQFEHLFDKIRKSETVMNRLELKNLDLKLLDQDKLINCLLTKTKKFEYNDPEYINMINVETLVGKLLQDLPEFKLSHLSLSNFPYSDELGKDLANALCKIKHLRLCDLDWKNLVAVKQLIQNILTGPVNTKTLILTLCVNFRTLINPHDLRKVIEKFDSLLLWGKFTLEQLEAARAVAQVKEKRKARNGSPIYLITKGRREKF